MYRIIGIAVLLMSFWGFAAHGQQTPSLYKLSGKVTDAEGHPLIGAYVLIKPGNRSVAVDENGRFGLMLAPGKYSIESQYLGMETLVQEVDLKGNRNIQLALKQKNLSLNQVEITTRPTMDVNSTNMGSTHIDAKLLTRMPALLGEVDVIRSVSSLPGVVNAGEGTAGFYVRGGSADQNLVLLDDAPVFNSSHLFGFFSVYNPDVLKSYTLHRSGISAEYGGRISSILDVRLRDGDTEKMRYFAGISPVSGKLGFEGPLSSNLSVVFAARGAYPKYLMRFFPTKDIKESEGHFYDTNLKVNYKLNDKNSLALSTYYSADGFKFPYDTTYHWTNKLGSLKWSHVYSKDMSSNLTLVKSVYDNNVEGIAKGEEFILNSGIDYTQLKVDFGYYGIQQHEIAFGAGASDYQIQPGRLKPYGTSSLNPIVLQRDKGMEYYAYLNDDMQLSDKLSVSVGLRYSYYVKRGPADVYLFEEGKPRNRTSIVDTLQYGSGRVVSYNGLEPRASAKYSLNSYSSLKAGFSRTRQYIQLITNTAAITPVDVWKLSNTYVKPQVADQLSLGYFNVRPDNSYEFSWEMYYKFLYNQIDYKDGAELLLNKALEADLLFGKGAAYGSEWLLKKNSGRLTGWFSVSLSRSFRTVAGDTPEETINDGERYPSNYDKPVNVNVFANYQLTPTWTASANFNYSTGRPITASDSWYYYYGDIYANYVGRNQARMPDYHRLDISFNYDYKKKNNVEKSWGISIYNLYSRRNAYSTIFKHYYGSIPQVYKLSIIGIPVPSVNFNIKF